MFKEALTFDDVLLLPQRSEVLPSEVNIETYEKPYWTEKGILARA